MRGREEGERRSFTAYFLLQVLHSSGQSFRSSWSVVLDVIQSATQMQRCAHTHT